MTLQNPVRLILGGAVAVVALILITASLYVLPEWEQAVITQFGRPLAGGAVKDPGLHFKVPFIQVVNRFDKRILNWDGYPNQIPTKDKKYILVDTTARWRIINPLAFLQTVQTERGARSRLDAILDAVTRDTISKHNLVEAVRNSNTILENMKDKMARQKSGELKPGNDLEEFVGEIEPVTVGREALSAQIIQQAKSGLDEFGIELIDVQLRRIAYEASVEAKVYERMISERQRIAQHIRSVGQGEKAKIEGKISKDLKEIESEAYRRVEIAKGTADAKAIRIYAQAMNADPGLYKFLRTLEAYQKAIPEGSTLLLSTDSEFLRLLRGE
ncbi:MAG: protease modulator HflC [Elusimicrobia bacterium]|jgi:membrane protease subunit HflC|nr:protease modulator HflC [Elusimicrobiota bacterium]MBK7208560.1 protease modulator HflC [Elusimicrobiota bacterium]MBK7688584.1 protease modulator HflC [Elusimicrobiota bacterium]MBK8126991.1 protease modulator HflC [Elusimicrobiota bacterium]MBK8423789.1 protease modulator HflC [Elusimicrobiota bacterium]